MDKWNPFNKEVKFYPYSHYAQQAKRASVFESFAGMVYVLDYKNVRNILSDPDTFEVSFPILPKSLDLKHLRNMLNGFFMYQSGEMHKLYRRTASKAFNYKKIESLVRLKIDELIGTLKGREKFDLIVDFATPLHSSIICKLLGIPEADAGLMVKWGMHLFLIEDFFYSTEILSQANKTAKEFSDYLRDRIHYARDLDASTFLGKMQKELKENNHEDDDQLETVINITSFLVTSAIETVSSVLGNSIYHLTSQPGKYEFIRNNPQSIALATEELIRFDPPIQFALRKIKRDCLLNGTQYKAGKFLALGIGAANRDEIQFEHPNELILDRRKNPHLAFGLGRHHCLGANLARIYLRFSLPAIATAFPSLSLSDQAPILRPANILKGFKSMPVVSN